MTITKEIKALTKEKDIKLRSFLMSSKDYAALDKLAKANDRNKSQQLRKLIKDASSSRS